MNGDELPTPVDHHGECGCTAADYGDAVLICHGTFRADVVFYATAEQAVSAARHCRAPDAVGHRLVHRDAAGQLRTRTLDYTPQPLTTDRQEPTDDHQ